VASVAALAASACFPADAAAQALAPRPAPPLAFEDRHVALIGVDVVDGTGAATQRDMTVVVRDGRIASVGPAASTPAPAGARRIDAKGSTLTPGFVLMHEHLFYPIGMSDRGFG
jgi:imidazolonepropionase-like amidohydrolase